MKLTDIAEQVSPPELRQEIMESISSRLAALEASEESSILEPGGTRLLVASDVALLDCDFEGDQTRRFKIEVIPWDAVPVPWIVYVGFLPWNDERVEASMTLHLEREFHAMYPPPNRKIAEDFYLSVLRHWRPKS